MKISVNYDELWQQSVLLKNRKEEYQGIIETMNSLIHEMFSIWQGDDQLTFVSKFDELYPRLHQLTQLMEEYANVLQKSALMYQQLQEQRIAQARLLA